MYKGEGNRNWGVVNEEGLKQEGKGEEGGGEKVEEERGYLRKAEWWSKSGGEGGWEKVKGARCDGWKGGAWYFEGRRERMKTFVEKWVIS